MKTLAPHKQDFFNNIANEFDSHIENSIPLFKEFRNNLVYNIANKYNEANIIDICGSTAKLGRELLKENFKGSYTCLDGSIQMKKVFENTTSKNDKKKINFIQGGFLASWIENFEGETFNVQQYNANEKQFDISIEIVGFQFFTKERKKEVQEMKRISKTCIFFEKFNNKDVNLYAKNEVLKNTLHKSKVFSQKEIENKQKNVLNDMHNFCYDNENFVHLLKENFKYVRKIFKAGNFEGFMCSDSPIQYNIDSDLINNKFNA
tara:strand:+ start:2536 stop:3321 length:786 start_codon:yes stop_codon:yes gene_type:complete